MYELKTLLPKVEIDLPTCMYSLRKCGLDDSDLVGAGRNCLSSGDQSNKNSSIQIRQDRLIEQLHDLRNQLSGIRSTLNLCAKPAQAPLTSFVGNQLKEEPLQDIVINAHPNFVPYALLAVKHAWKNLFNISIKAYSHSTIPSISKEAQEFQTNLESIKSDESKPKINITLIWKNCEHTEMISSPTMYVPIYGEVNIVRYLGRVGPQEYRYENSVLCNEIDAVLDICYQLLRCSTNKARSALIRSLNGYLQKQKYFGGDAMSIADIAVSSTLKRLPQITCKDLTSDLNNWHKLVKPVTLI